MVQKYRKTSAYIKNKNKIRLYMKGGAKDRDESSQDTLKYIHKQVAQTSASLRYRLVLVCMADKH